MAQVTLPHTISAGEALDASKVQANLDALVAAINSIDGTQLALDSVGASSIVDASVTGAKLADGSVTEDKIAAGAVSTAKVEDGAITNAKLDNVVKPLVLYEIGPVTVSGGGTTTVDSGSIFDTSKEPVFSVMWQDGGGGPYRLLGSRDSSGNEMPNIHVSASYVGAEYHIVIFNDSGATVLFRVSMVGEPA